MKKKIAIFVPTYNEAETINDVLSNIPQEILGYPTVIVISDDHSTDATITIARHHTAHVITSRRNGGVGTSTKKGFRYIARLPNIDFVIKFDGDGQHMLHFLPKIAERLRNGEDLVICSRFHPLSDQSNTPTDRMLLNMIFTEMLRKITGWDVTDVRSGYMGIPIHHVKSIADKIIVRRYGIPMEIILRIWAKKSDARVSEIAHPALYGPHISEKLTAKYSNETIAAQADRLHMAYTALLEVVEDLKIPRERILEMNGFHKKHGA